MDLRRSETFETGSSVQNELREIDTLFDDHFGRCRSSHSVCNQVVDQTVEHNYEENCARLITELNLDQVESNKDLDPFLEEDLDLSNIKKTVESGCGCKLRCLDIGECKIYDHILNIREMEKSLKEIYVMSSVSCSSSDNPTKRGDRKQSHSKFTFEGKVVCRNAFKVLFDIGESTLRNILAHVKRYGVTPRTHGNKGKKAKHALTFDDIDRIVRFISNYADEHGFPQPAAPRGRDHIPPIYLHSSLTKQAIHCDYTDSIPDETRAVKYRSFLKIWNSLLGHIKIASPKDDVCGTCEKLRKQIVDAVSEDEKLEASTQMQVHIQFAKSERAVYQACITEARDELYNVVIPDTVVPPLSTQFEKVHYTFDFAQNLQLPHHSRQIGPLYFLSTRKIQLFGVRLDGIPLQLNYLIDEDQSIGQDGSCTHGPNTVITLLDETLTSYGLGERICRLHSDNCAGQNKNRFVLAYLAWRVMTGRHHEITLMMQVAGHARCLVDAGFAHIKKLYRRCDIDCLDEMASVVDKSAFSNKAVLYSRQDGTTNWVWRNWKEFLGKNFKALKGISTYQHFRFCSTFPGYVFCKREVSDEEVSFYLLKDGVEALEGLPDIIRPAGLSNERANYLYRNVRQYVRPIFQDITCPPL